MHGICKGNADRAAKTKQHTLQVQKVKVHGYELTQASNRHNFEEMYGE